jgi:hypothetical protein
MNIRQDPKRSNKHDETDETYRYRHEPFESFIPFVIHGLRVVVGLILWLSAKEWQPAEACRPLEEAPQRGPKARVDLKKVVGLVEVGLLVFFDGIFVRDMPVLDMLDVFC